MRARGLIGRENAGMSNEKTGEIPVRRKPKGSWVKESSQGESAPKARPKGVVDGKLVNIPVPLYELMGRRMR